MEKRKRLEAFRKVVQSEQPDEKWKIGKTKACKTLCSSEFISGKATEESWKFLGEFTSLFRAENANILISNAIHLI